ncbi:RHS repeat domain-containing protein [Acinetobacter nosocomialis]|uniref:RHS repeat domain-containing protein n=1 Tax=Acinetobacter nosocomialis TaxID=106654 RepID=UPI002D1F61B3|nr:RHS repeat-associated core domain-containing protein [Acinetobacter nosocomialis]MEB3852269.1 RHS repeat protein [Acinetobacter nosocomialis]
MMNLIKSKVLKLIYVFFSILTILYQYSYADMYTVDKESIVSFDPNIKSCTAGYNLLSGQINYSKNLISGALPYNLHYRKATRLQTIDQENSIGVDSWSDNYDGFVNVFYGTYRAKYGYITITNYVIKLPNDNHRYYFKYGPTSFKETGYPEPFLQENNRALYRLYTSSEPEASSLPGGGYVSGNASTDFGEIKFSIASNSMTVTRAGVVYSATVSKSINNEILFRFNKITYPNGNTINLSYDNQLNLVQVTDNKNNKLSLVRNGSQVSSVSFTGGTQADSQKYDLTYSSIQAGGISYPQLTQVKNAKNGRKEDYTYDAALSLSHYETALDNNVSNPETAAQRPILKSVSDNSNQVRQTWKVDYPSVVVTTSGIYKTITAVKVILQSYLGESTGTKALDTTTTYDDIQNSSKISMLFSPDGNQSANTVINTTHPDYKKTIIDVSGFPCLTTGDNRPIKSIVYAPSEIHPTQITDQNGNITAYAFDTLNRILQVVEASGTTISRTTNYVYGVLSNGLENLFNIPTTIKTSNFTITNEINEKGQIVKQTESSTQVQSTSKVTTYNYFTDITKPNNGLLSSKDGPRSGTLDKISYTYDNYGNLASVSTTINGTERTEQYVGYNSFGDPERIVYPNGMVEKYTYNDDGTISSVVTGSGSTAGTITGKTVTFCYDSLGQLVGSLNEDGEKTSYYYDNLGRIIKTIYSDGSISTKNYFNNNIISSDEVKDSSAITVFKGLYRTLDLSGRINKIQIGTDSTSNWKTLGYDGNGNVIQTKTAQGIIESWTYDALNRPISHIDGSGNTDTKTYDALDNPITVLDALSSGTNPYLYRNGNVLAQETNKDFGIKSYSYNEADQLVQSIYGNRKCSFSNIDEIGRNKTIQCQSNSSSTPDMLTYDDTYTFDSSRYSRLDKIVSNKPYGVDISYVYDLYDRIIGKSQSNKALTAFGSSANTLSNTYAWSIGNKITGITLPSGRKLTYNYDNTSKGQITGLTLDGNALLSNIGYDASGQMTGWTWGSNAGSYTWTYSSAKDGVINQISNKNSGGAVTYSLNYSFDRDNRIISIKRNNNLNDNFSYDQEGRLLTESRSNDASSIYAITYTYDKNGNRLSLRASGTHLQPAANVDYAYTGNKLTTLTKNGTAQPLNYTANAELYMGEILPSYDYAGRRRGEGTSTTINRYMSYNANNERTLSGSTSAWSNTAVQFIYDEKSHLIGEYTATGIPLVEYIWLGDKPVAAVYESGATTKIYYIVTDVQNTPRRLIDSNGSVVWSWDSTAFGLGSPVSTITFNLRFPGQYYDATTGQFYNHNRFYNPELGRYMEPDPIGLAGGLNPYIYALNNPVMYVDMTGENPILIAMGVSAATAGAFYTGEVFFNAVYDAYKNDQSILDSFSKSFSIKELGQQMVIGAAFGGVGKAAFLAADVHIISKAAPTIIPAGTSVLKRWGLKGLNAINNMAKTSKINKIREVTTPAGLVLTGNIIAGKTTTNLILNDINERSSARRQGGGEVGNSGINQGSDYLGFKSYQPNGYVAGYSEMYINGVYNGRLWTIYFDSGDTVQYGCYLKCALPL